MKKAKSYRKELQFEINGSSTETLDKNDEDVLRNEFGFYKFEASGVKGFMIGRTFGYHEREGEGLPTEKDSNSHHKEFNLNFDIRISHDGKGNVEFLVARKGAGTHFKFPLKNLTAMQAESALAEFEQRMIQSYITQTLYYIAWACYRKQDNSVHNRKESYYKIIANLENHFRNILNRRGEKIVDEIEKDGYKFTTYEAIEGGRNKGTKKPRQLSKREIENRDSRKQKILEAMREAIDSENKSELAHIIGISRPTLNNWLKSIGVNNKEDFYHLIRFAERELQSN